MINDEVIWQTVNTSFCSFKAKVQKHNFCRNEYNVTGLCNRSACPLANGRYATIREEEGRCYLLIKTIERAHMPKKLWAKTLLPQNYTAALALVSTELEHFPKFLQHRNKQRLTRVHQYLIRMRKLALRHDKPTISVIHKKVEVRESRREVKALKAAKLNESIQNELLERLKQGTYGDIYNFPSMAYDAALDEAASEEEEEESDEEEEEAHETEYVEGDFDEEDEDLEDMEGIPEDEDDELSRITTKRPAAVPTRQFDAVKTSAPKRRKKQKRVEIEYDEEDEEEMSREAVAQYA